MTAIDTPEERQGGWHWCGTASAHVGRSPDDVLKIAGALLEAMPAFHEPFDDDEL